MGNVDPVALERERLRVALLMALEARDLRREVERLLVTLDRETRSERPEARHKARE